VHEKFEPMEEDQGIFNAVLLQINTNTGEAISIEKIIKRTDKLYP